MFVGDPSDWKRVAGAAAGNEEGETKLSDCLEECLVSSERREELTNTTSHNGNSSNCFDKRWPSGDESDAVSFPMIPAPERPKRPQRSVLHL